MKTMAMTLGAALLAACGGSDPQPARPQPDPKTAEPEPEPEPFRAPADDDLMAEEPLPAPAAEAEPELVPAATEPTMTTITASAKLMNAKGTAELGFVKFGRDPVAATITITGEFSGLKKNAQHAFYIHENGDCSKGGKHVGGHLDPTGAKHGPPASAQRHAGDFGNLVTDAEGNALFEMTTDSITIEPGRADSVIGRAVVIHANKDDKKGKGGPVLACGVVDLD